jgi:hypothetical protein
VVKLYSRRKISPPDYIRFDIPDDIRTRILVVFRDHSTDFDSFLESVGNALFKQYGGLAQSAYAAARRSDHPVIEHFYCSDIDHALDFIEAGFQQFTYRGGQSGVNEINEIFRETGIGYELTPFVEHRTEKAETFYGKIRGGIAGEYEYPRIIRRDHQLAHQEIVEPALNLLTDSRLRIANAEMLKALSALRHGDFEDAITSSASAFESFLKTICDIKNWKYNSDRDTCAKLVSICRDHGLFPPFFAPIFEAVGTIRNKLGDAHGRGPAPLHSVSQEHAEHMVHVTLSHMLLIAKLANLG